MDELIRSILADHGRLSADVATLDDDADLYRVGLTSHASVNVMLALEDEFGVEVPDTMLRKATFQTIASMRATIVTLTSQAESA
jgi:acyl carrier protein